MLIHKYDLVLLGNLIIDNIYCIPNWIKEGTSNLFNTHTISIGGIGNLLSTFQNHQLNILIEGNIGDNQLEIKKILNNYSFDYKLHYRNGETSQAIILSNLQTSERTSFVNWGVGMEELVYSNFSCNWAHISYLDICQINLKSLKNQAKVISADLCLSNPNKDQIEKVLNQLQYLDYLIISEQEIFPFINCPKFNDEIVSYWVKKYQLKNLILHKKDRSYIINENYVEILNPNKLMENVNVLGAGDIYCANFILSQLNNNDLNDSIIYAHQQANQFVALNK